MSISDPEGVHRLTIRRGGQAYRGRWHATEDAVQVVSPYGQASVPRGGEAPRALAETLLGELAFRWCATAGGRA